MRMTRFPHSVPRAAGRLALFTIAMAGAGVAGAAADHPIVRHLDPKRFHSPSWLYNLRPLASGTTLLLEGRWKEGEPEQPVAFTNIHEGARVFYTSLGHEGDFANRAFNEMLRNAVYWALEMAVPGGDAARK